MLRPKLGDVPLGLIATTTSSTTRWAPNNSLIHTLSHTWGLENINHTDVKSLCVYDLSGSDLMCFPKCFGLENALAQTRWWPPWSHCNIIIIMMSSQELVWFTPSCTHGGVGKHYVLETCHNSYKHYKVLYVWPAWVCFGVFSKMYWFRNALAQTWFPPWLSLQHHHHHHHHELLGASLFTPSWTHGH